MLQKIIFPRGGQISMQSKLTGNKFLCMEFVFVICICKCICICRPTAFTNLLKKKFFSQVLLKLFSLVNQFQNFIIVFENTTFSSFKLQMNALVNNASGLSFASERLKVFTRYETYRHKISRHRKNFQQRFQKIPANAVTYISL